jgi:hypothetical protein
VLDPAVRSRFQERLTALSKDKGDDERRFMGALRALLPLSPTLRIHLLDAVTALAKKGAFERDLFTGGVRALAELGDKAVAPVVKGLLLREDGGGLAAFTAACFLTDASLTTPLTKLAGSRQSHLAFCAELGRVFRGESTGQLLASLAPMIKESHRLELCERLFFPLVRHRNIPAAVGPGVAVLRSAERHLGRWLVLSEVAARGGELSALEESVAKTQSGPQSARSGWALVNWALRASMYDAGKGPDPGPPEVRPTVELMARLSDRPSADRDPTFLFRMAESRAALVRPLLENIAKGPPFTDEASARAGFYLARDHGRDDMRAALLEASETPAREDLRGLIVALLWDLGERGRARDCTADLLASLHFGNAAWGGLLKAAHLRSPSGGPPVVTEVVHRWAQLGWIE